MAGVTVSFFMVVLFQCQSTGVTGVRPFQEFLYKWMDQQHVSTVLALEVQSKVADMEKYKQESELNLQVIVLIHFSIG